MFGDRGAGKSATRLTVFKEIWADTGDVRPFLVNMTDFTDLQPLFKKDKLTDKEIVALVAFVVVEQMLVWLASLPEEERDEKIENLNVAQRDLVYALIKGFYLTKPELDREISNQDALNLLNSAWTTKSAIWTERRWGDISNIIAAALNVFSRKVSEDDGVNISQAAENLLKSLVGDSPQAPRATLTKLVDFSKAFGFSGVCVLVDKVDETPTTSNSAESTAKLVHPLLTHYQLLEVSGFSWVLFLWSMVQAHFNGKYSIRLDKIAHANISWEERHLKEMLDKRVRYFSDGRKDFSDLFEPEVAEGGVAGAIIALVVGSPRELVKLMDIIIREHNARDIDGLIDAHSVNIGIDKYCVETIGTWYPEAVLQQVYRVGKLSFVNKDVQGVFKISDQGARTKIKGWEDSGLIKLSGTVPSEAGGKPVNKYVVSDPRVVRIISNLLDANVGVALEDSDG
ncbi:hypothetical protein D3C84_418880 [compost metagenome]